MNYKCGTCDVTASQSTSNCILKIKNNQLLTLDTCKKENPVVIHKIQANSREKVVCQAKCHIFPV